MDQTQSQNLNLPAGVNPVIAKDGTKLDPYAVAMAKAIREHESGGNYQAHGKSGEYGAYQFTKPTWQKLAGSYLGNSNADLTPENQDKVAYGAAVNARQRGLTPQEFAAEWNSGSAKGWENKRGVNQYGVKYDVPAYVNAVYSNYQKFKPVPGAGVDTSGGDIASQRAAHIAAGQPVSTDPNRVEPTFGGNIIRGIIRPFVRAINTPIEGVRLLAGESPTTAAGHSDYLGDISGFGMKQGQTPGQRVKDIAGGVLDIASNFVGGGGAVSVAEQGLKGLIKEGAITGLKTGAVAGALQGAGSSLQNDQGFGETALNTGVGALTGGALGGVAGAGGSIASHFAGTAANKIFGWTPKVTAQEYEKAVQGLGEDYKTILNQTGLQEAKEAAVGKDAAYHMATLAAEGKQLPLKTDGRGNLITTAAQATLNDKVIKPENDLLDSLLKSENKAVSFDQMKKDVESDVLKEFSGLKREQASRRLNAEFINYEKQYKNKFIEMGDGTKGLKLEDVNKIKRDFWKNAKTKFNSTDAEKLAADVNYQIGHSLKNQIEQNVSDVSIKELNQRLGDHQNLLSVLRKRNGRSVGMTKTKELLYRLAGAAVGSHFSPIGAAGEMVGYFTGGRLARLLENPNIDTYMARNILKQYGVKDPKIIKQVEELIKARADAQAAAPKLPTPSFIPMGPETPKAQPFTQQGTIAPREPLPVSAQLPEGKPGTIPGPTIKLPAKSQSALDIAEQKNIQEARQLQTVRNVSNTLSGSIEDIKKGSKFGVSVNPDGQEYAGKDAIATIKSVNVPKSQLTKAKIDEILAADKDILNKFPDQLVVGLFDMGDGNVSVDLNVKTPDRKLARNIARSNNQQSYWDAGKMQAISTGGTGVQKLSDAEITSILKDLRTGTNAPKPLKNKGEIEPYTPPEKLPVIKMGPKPKKLTKEKGLPIIR